MSKLFASTGYYKENWVYDKFISGVKKGVHKWHGSLQYKANGWVLH